MKMKKYSDFIISESYYGPKNELYNFFLQNKQDIEDKGLDFNSIKLELEKVLDCLSDSDVSYFLQSINDLKGLDKEEFGEKLNRILIDISHKVISNVSEGFFQSITEFFNKVKKFIVDKIYIIYGLSMTGLGVYLSLSDTLQNMGILDGDIKNWISGGVLFLGLVGLAYSNKK